MSGLKKLENNKSIFNYYRFWGYYLTYSDLFTQNYPHMSVGLIKPLSISPSLEESKWNPPKEIENINDKSNEELVPDNELFDESFLTNENKIYRRTLIAIWYKSTYLS